MVVAQLVERSLLKPEIRFHTVIGKKITYCTNENRKDKTKEKEAGKGPLKKRNPAKACQT